MRDSEKPCVPTEATMDGSVYAKARREWDERYADLVLGKHNWQIAAAGLI